MNKLLYIVILSCVHLHLNAQTLELYEQLRQQQINDVTKKETASTPFTLVQIEAVNQTFDSKDDFIRHVSQLKLLGVDSYTTYFSDGHIEYFGKDYYKIVSEPKYPTLSIAADPNIAVFKKHLKSYQKGKTSFISYCNDSAMSGVAKSIVDTVNMSSSYYDSADRLLFTETIAP